MVTFNVTVTVICRCTHTPVVVAGVCLEKIERFDFEMGNLSLRDEREGRVGDRDRPLSGELQRYLN